MALTLADIERWDAGAVRDVSDALASRGASATDVREGLSKLPLLGTWHGSAGEAAKASLDKLSAYLAAHGLEMSRLSAATREAADDIERIKASLLRLEGDANRGGFLLDMATGEVTPRQQAGDPMQFLEQLRLEERVTELLQAANTADTELAQAMTTAVDAATGQAPLPDVLSQPLPEDPKQFHDFWEQLSEQERNQLYERDHNIGNRPGMPFADKNTYNQRHLDELLSTTQSNVGRLQQRYSELAAQVYMGDKSTATGSELAALGPQLTQARKQLEGYRAVEGVLNNKDGAPRYLALLDEQGRAAVSIGNPDTASRTATFVPGTGQDMAAFEGSDRKSEEMFRATLLADPRLTADDVAVTTWMGYDRPMDLTEAAWPGRAEAGGAGLDAFVDGMRASYEGAGPSIDTVIGHSYGSSLVGGAATDGNHLAVDNVIAVGSPGMLSDHASGLSLDEGAKVYSMTARNDIISLATDMTLGADPYSPDYGATRLWANPGTSWDPLEFIGSVEAHSSYWDSQSNPALENMGAIIAGLPPTSIVTPDGGVTRR